MCVCVCVSVSTSQPHTSGEQRKHMGAKSAPNMRWRLHSDSLNLWTARLEFQSAARETRPTRQMERFPNPLNLSHLSMWERDCGKCLETEAPFPKETKVISVVGWGRGIKGNWTSHLRALKRTNQVAVAWSSLLETQQLMYCLVEKLLLYIAINCKYKLLPKPL